MSNQAFASLEDAKTYALAGNAIITLHSKRTDRHFTFKIRAAKENQVHFVTLLTGGSADDGHFTYLGCIAGGAFRLTKNSQASATCSSVKAFDFFMKSKSLHPELAVHHEGRCGRCGRTLTVPSSIETGIGPECAKHI